MKCCYDNCDKELKRNVFCSNSHRVCQWQKEKKEDEKNAKNFMDLSKEKQGKLIEQAIKGANKMQADMMKEKE